MTRKEWARRKGRSAHWATKRMRSAIFERDRCACVWCGAAYPLTLDHVVPRRLGGTHDTRNLITSCFYCNSKRGAMRVQVFAATLSMQPGGAPVSVILRSVRNAQRRVVRL